MAKSKSVSFDADTVPVSTTKTVMLNMRVSESMMRWLEDAAKKRELPVSALARMFLLERLNQEPMPAWMEAETAGWKSPDIGCEVCNPKA